MRMKDVLARTGLSDRAVRLYIENGLLSPRQDSSYAGRKSITFSEEDVEILEVIATLRRAGFSLSDIRRMQEDPSCAREVLEGHRDALTEEIEQKQEILKKLSAIPADTPISCRTIADGIRASASSQTIPKEDSNMSFRELKTLLQRRTTSLFTFVFLLLGSLGLFSVTLRAAFAKTRVLVGGGFKLDYAFHWESLVTYMGGFIAVLLVLAAAVCAFAYILRGKRSLQISTLVLTVASALILLLLPAAVKEGMFFYEFIDYRFSFMHGIFFSAEQWFDILIQSLKFVPLMAAAILSAVGLYKDEPR